MLIPAYIPEFFSLNYSMAALLANKLANKTIVEPQIEDMPGKDVEKFLASIQNMLLEDVEKVLTSIQKIADQKKQDATRAKARVKKAAHKAAQDGAWKPLDVLEAICTADVSSFKAALGELADPPWGEILLTEEVLEYNGWDDGCLTFAQRQNVVEVQECHVQFGRKSTAKGQHGDEENVEWGDSHALVAFCKGISNDLGSVLRSASIERSAFSVLLAVDDEDEIDCDGEDCQGGLLHEDLGSLNIPQLIERLAAGDAAQEWEWKGHAAAFLAAWQSRTTAIKTAMQGEMKE